MDRQLRNAVRARAGDRCEYCERRQVDSPLISLQIEHCIPRKHGGSDDLDNLALACADCNLRKSSDLAGIDPETHKLTALFHPRRDNWDTHFVWQALRIIGKTAVGRTTVEVLQLNASSRLRLRMAVNE